MNNFKRQHFNLYQNSITMHRIGRDSVVPHFNPVFCSTESIFMFFYGEVDCRCQIQKQIDLGRDLESIIEELTSKYIETITNTIKVYKRIIISCVPPPINKYEYESIHGEITHEFPFVGSDSERIHFTRLVNASLKEKIEKVPNCVFLDFTEHYSRPDGTLIKELSDGGNHIKENQYILDLVYEILNEF